MELTLIQFKFMITIVAKLLFLFLYHEKWELIDLEVESLNYIWKTMLMLMLYFSAEEHLRWTMCNPLRYLYFFKVSFIILLTDKLTLSCISLYIPLLFHYIISSILPSILLLNFTKIINSNIHRTKNNFISIKNQPYSMRSARILCYFY
jgi:hypothetical protein